MLGEHGRRTRRRPRYGPWCGAERWKSLHAIVEIGEHHGAMCFADGIQHITQCTFGKGNIEKSHAASSR